MRVTKITVFVLSVIFSDSMNVAKAANVDVNLNDNVNNPGNFIQIQGTNNTAYNLDNMKAENVTQDGQIYNLQGDRDRLQDEIDVSKGNISTNTAAISSLQTNVSNVDQEAKLAGALADTANKKGDAALQGVLTNGTAITHIETVNTVQDSRLLALENAPKPTNGVDGKDGAKGDTGADGKDGKDGKDGSNGVTTTITQVDTATQTKVAANTAAIASTSTQAAGVAQDLQDAKKVFSQQQASTNAQFKSLRDEVDGNKKEARSGAASAIAIASMPQVEAGQKVMFSAGVGSFKNESAVSVGASFHAGAATVKAGVSSSSNNDFALGAGLGVGF
ncbi:YadA C-terminal domain-containing protein [Enterobacter sp. ECC-019]|uniref:YadA C-terminal domain-containing protein n=1 Tax=Enterobacter sp. ECC-019 TaxID=3116478 RepID=UPI0037553DDD